MKYRNNGAVGAILDEYEKTLNELMAIIANVSDEQLIQIVDTDTKDEDCRSIQTILTHVVHSGYNYIVAIRKWLGEPCSYKDKKPLSSVEAYQIALKEIFRYNEQLFIDHPELKWSAFDPDSKIKVRWGQLYDVEQLLEHAIVHILRHRRQIERFKLKINSKGYTNRILS